MAWRFVRQPNGKLARYSDVVENFTHFNLSREEAVRVALAENCGAKEAEIKVRAGEEDHKPWRVNVPGDGTERWRDCLESIREITGPAALRLARKMGES